MVLENNALIRDENISASIVVTDKNLYEVALKKKEAAIKANNEKKEMMDRISSLESKMDLILSAINKISTEKN
jgi:hypothetical protein